MKITRDEAAALRIPPTYRHRQNVSRSEDGRVWCSAGARNHFRGVKQRYDSIDEAWLAAFVEFSRRGEVMTPYHCGPPMFFRCQRVYVVPHPNPWSFRAWYVKIYPFTYAQRRCCNGWHLTKRPYDHALPGAA